MNFVDLLTPEADRKPPARFAMSSSQQSPTASNFVDLTVETTPILSERRFFVNSENLTMTPMAHKFPVLALPRSLNTSDNISLTHTSVSQSSPQKKKSRHLANGKENFDVIGPVGVLGGVENIKAPFLVPRKNPNSEVSICHSDSVFSGPRIIPTSFVGQFLPQVMIPTDHPCGNIIRRAAVMMRSLPAYEFRRDYIEHRIWILCSMNVAR